jgi:TPP-dependent pyruvate/acetoin dehydrogenase alpha subunit
MKTFLKDSLLNLWREMTRIRMVEKEIARRYSEREMRCPVHLSIGQECAAACISAHLTREDRILSTHRAHAHYLAKGGSLKAMLSEIYGRTDGCTGGRGGSMHLMDLDAGVQCAVPIVGGTIPIGVGVAFGLKLKKIDGIVVVYLGEGATEEGIFSESLDFAALFKLPVLFVVENNSYSIYTHVSHRQARGRSLTKLAEAHGVQSSGASDFDPLTMFDFSRKAIDYVRKTGLPYLLEFETHRWVEHCGPNIDDHLNYRDKDEIDAKNKICPISIIESTLHDRGWFDGIAKGEIIDDIKTEIAKAFEFALNSESPRVETLHDHLYPDRYSVQRAMSVK